MRAWKAVLLIDLGACLVRDQRLRVRGLESFVEPELHAGRGLDERRPLGGDGLHEDGVSEGRSRPERQDSQPGRDEPPSDPHLIFSIVVTATFGRTPCRVNRTASPTETAS